MLPTVLLADKLLAAKTLKLAWPIQLTDEVIRELTPAQTQGIHERLEEAHIIECSNVFDFLYEQHGLDNPGAKPLKVEDLVLVRPPFPVTWLEYGTHERDFRVGVMLGTEEVTGADLLAKVPATAKQCADFSGPVSLDETVLLSHVAIYHGYRDEVRAALLGDVVMRLDGTVACPLFFFMPQQKDEAELDALALDGMALAFPAFFGLQFLNCRNVQQAERLPSPNQSKARQRLTGKPLLRYHTLQIEPMRKIFQEEGEVQKNGLKRALHIVRGHFATYTPEKGMLGRALEAPVKVWRTSHTRGSMQEGIVVKDYKVNATQTKDTTT